MHTTIRLWLGWIMLFTLAAAVADSIPAIAQNEISKSTSSHADRPSSPLGERSPWLVMPVFSSNPKLGTSFGVLAGYLYYFDEKSRPSIFALTGQYTTTDSIVSGIFARTSFDEDHQRLIAALLYGNIKNDYDNYLGTGVPLKNDTEIRALISRYTYRITGNWFGGAQAIYQNFAIAGDKPFDDQVLDILGIQPFKSVGLGVVIQNDSRDNENIPTRGMLLNLNNLAFRESLGGENDYDSYRIEIRYFFPHGKGNVFALRQLNHLTNDAPAAALAPVQLRGYKVGQFTGKYMSAIEVEERYRFATRWTATLFAGVACLYGDGESCLDSDNVFPAGGAGVQYILKPKEGIVLNLEYAQGEGASHGVYLKMGYGF